MFVEFVESRGRLNASEFTTEGERFGERCDEMGNSCGRRIVRETISTQRRISSRRRNEGGRRTHPGRSQ